MKKYNFQLDVAKLYLKYLYVIDETTGEYVEANETVIPSLSEKSGIENGVEYTLTISGIEDYAGNLAIEIAANTLEDNSGNFSDSTGIVEIGTVDFVNPVITYERLETVLDKEQKKLYVVFNITDDNFSESTLKGSDITVSIDGVTATVEALNEIEDVTEIINGTEKTIGKKYQIVISNISDVETSETVTITIPAGIASDESENLSLGKTITTNFIETDIEEPGLAELNIVSPITGNYKEGQVVTIKAVFNEYVYNSEGNKLLENEVPTLKIIIGDGEEKTAEFDNVNKNVITYIYRISDGDNGIITLSKFEGFVYDKAGNELEVIADTLGGHTITADTTPLELEKISLITAGGKYKAGQEIEFKTIFSEKLYNESLIEIDLETVPTFNIKFGEGTAKTAVATDIEYDDNTKKQEIIYFYCSRKSKVPCYGRRNTGAGCGIFLQLSGNVHPEGCL